MDFRSWTLIHLGLCITFILSGLFINVLQAVVFLILAPINRRLFRSVNYYFVYCIYGQLLFLADWWSGSILRIFCDPALHTDVMSGLGNEHSVILMNHHYELDWLYGWMVADRSGLLGNCRVYVKKMLKYVPVVGWAWGFSDTVFLERNWEKDKDNLSVKLNQLLDYPSPMWLLIFAEGTRLSEEKMKASQDFARKRGIPVLHHHLIPRSKGFTFTMSRLDKDRINTVYDVTLVAGLEGAAPTLTEVLNGRASVANMYIRKFSLKDIPKDEEAASQWLMKLYQEKDDLKHSFLETGSFSEMSGQPDYPVHVPSPRPWSLLLSLSLNLSTWLFLLWLVLSGGMVTRLVAVVLVMLAYVAMRKLIGLTKIGKASSYGIKKD